MKWLLVVLFLLAPAVPAQEATKPEWVVCFTFKQDNPKEPVASLRVVVHASSEGEAAIRAQRYFADRLSIKAADDLIFCEAQMRK